MCIGFYKQAHKLLAKLSNLRISKVVDNLGTATMNPNNVNRNLFSSNQRGSGETDDGSECSDDSILDTMARIDTEIRLRDVNVELSREAETLGQIGDSEEAGVGIDDQNSPEVGETNINYLASPTGTTPYDAMTGASGSTVTDERTSNRKKKLLMEKLFLEKELRRRIELKKNKRVRTERIRDPH